MTGERRARLATCVALVFLTSFSPFMLLPGPPRLTITSTAGGLTLAWTDPYALVQHKIPGNNSEPWGIATGPDGDVWFVEQGTNRLGMYDPVNGSFRQYQIPTSGSTPSSVAVDSAGNVWFTELTANNLGELPFGASAITEISVPHSSATVAGFSQKLDCGPGPVLTDPRGSIWVGCLFSDQVDEYFPGNGTFARFDLPVFNSAPAGLALDGKGNLWFTAADAQMLGKMVISQLRNGTQDGISESPPINSTYVYSFDLATTFLGNTSKVKSSLPTPSGIAIDGTGKLWITEHVDTSFDSYNPATSSIVKYWTSQTFGAYGYDVSFPNGIAVDSGNNIWIGEHYGNKILHFDPATDLMVEYPVPCCKTVVAGVYSVALDRNGTLWFVEIDGSAIGEMVKTTTPFELGLTLPATAATIGQDGSAQFPLSYSLASGEAATNLNFSVSGVTATGAGANLSATFSPSDLTVTSGAHSQAVLSLQTRGIKPGVYYLTLTASASPRGDLYSTILKLTVTGGAPFPLAYVAVAVAVLTAASLGAAWGLSRRQRVRRRKRRA